MKSASSYLGGQCRLSHFTSPHKHTPTPRHIHSRDVTYLRGARHNTGDCAGRRQSARRRAWRRRRRRSMPDPVHSSLFQTRQISFAVLAIAPNFLAAREVSNCFGNVCERTVSETTDKQIVYSIINSLHTSVPVQKKT